MSVNFRRRLMDLADSSPKCLNLLDLFGFKHSHLILNAGFDLGNGVYEWAKCKGRVGVGRLEVYSGRGGGGA